MNLDDVTVFNDLRERLAKITHEQMEAIERKLRTDQTGKGETVIGVIESPATRGLWVLSMLLQAEHLLEHAKARMVVDETQEKDHQERAALLDMFSDVARELFWTQAKIDLAFYKEANVGLRTGWMMVETREDSGPQGLIEILRGKLPRIPEQ